MTATERGKAKLKSRKARDALLHKTLKDASPNVTATPNVPNIPPVSPSTRKELTSSDDNLEMAVLEDGKVKDTKINKTGSSTVTQASLDDGKVKDGKIHKAGSLSVTQASPSNDKVSPANIENAKDAGQNAVKQDSSSQFVLKRPSLPPAISTGSSVGPSKSGNSVGSQSTYGGLIDFENAILETGDDQADVKQAMIQRIRSKRYQAKTQYK